MSNLQNQNENCENKMDSDFPKNIFPKIIEEIMENYESILNFNYDYIGSAILSALSLACGNYAKIKIKNGWIESPILWIVLVGKAGINKSAPLSTFLKPFKERDKAFYEKYKKELAEYESNIKQNRKKQSKEEGSQEDVLVFPKRRQHLISDFTPEALSVAHEDNPHGITIYTDEILTWLNNFNRYNKGGEEQFYLSLWSGQEININRRNSNHIYIANPFISVCGTIQPNRLLEAFGKGRDKSGFTHRILFAYPDNVIREDFSENEISDVIVRSYNSIINQLIDLSQKNGINGPKIYELDKKAKAAFKEWRSNNNSRINNELNDELTGIYAKLEIYLLRISLIMQVLEDSIENKDNNLISENTFESAVQLINYFEYSALKVYKLISKYDDPLSNYPNDKKEFYKSLPPEFSTSEAEKVAQKSQIPRRTFFDFIKDDVLFEKTKHGHYLKKV